MALKRALRITGVTLGVLVLLIVGAAFVVLMAARADPVLPVYAENCAVCHGEALDGAAQGPALVGADLAHGESVDALAASIANGSPARGMPAWATVLDDAQIRGLAILIAEKRADLVHGGFRADVELTLPEGVIDSEVARFRLETVATGLEPSSFSIAPLPDGRILVTEKKKGLRIVAASGEVSALIAGTPPTSGYGLNIGGIDYGNGWLLDAAPHPDYEANGWIYLHHTHICTDCSDDGESFAPLTLNRVVRGRIVDGAWRDEEIVWAAANEFYTPTPDTGAGGRLAFDATGHVYLSIGIKGLGNYVGIQDLSTPYGKIHRVRDDGEIPPDNPFVGREDVLPSIWSYGHRSPQGLEYDPLTDRLWSTEMGPRGGDEVNLIRPGRNYGWPLTSKGLDYDGTPVEYGKDLGIEVDLDAIEQPVVDLTPAPAVSSFVVYAGAAFPAWRGNLIVGTLKATRLLRMELDGTRHLHTEVLIDGLARIRDVETDRDGLIYLLLEHESGSRIVRIVPA